MLHISFNAEELTENEVRGLKALVEALAWKTVPNARERLTNFATQVAKTDPMADVFVVQGTDVPFEVPQPDPGALQNVVGTLMLSPEDQKMFVETLANPPEPDEALQRAFARRDGIVVPVEEPAKRKRRTKAEMEADAAKAVAPTPALGHVATSEAFNHKLALLNDQMDAGKLPTEKRQAACKEWERRYAEDADKAMVDITEALGANKAFLEKVEAAKPLKSYTADELRPMLQDYTENHSMQDGLDLLTAFECARVTDVTKLPLEKQAEFVARLHA